MGLFGRLFGLGLVFAGIFIAVYWTLWTLMIVVSISLYLTFNPLTLNLNITLCVALDLSQVPQGSAGPLL